MSTILFYNRIFGTIIPRLHQVKAQFFTVRRQSLTPASSHNACYPMIPGHPDYAKIDQNSPFRGIAVLAYFSPFRTSLHAHNKLNRHQLSGSSSPSSFPLSSQASSLAPSRSAGHARERPSNLTGTELPPTHAHILVPTNLSVHPHPRHVVLLKRARENMMARPVGDEVEIVGGVRVQSREDRRAPGIADGPRRQPQG